MSEDNQLPACDPNPNNQIATNTPREVVNPTKEQLEQKTFVYEISFVSGQILTVESNLPPSVSGVIIITDLEGHEHLMFTSNVNYIKNLKCPIQKADDVSVILAPGGEKIKRGVQFKIDRNGNGN